MAENMCVLVVDECDLFKVGLSQLSTDNNIDSVPAPPIHASLRCYALFDRQKQKEKVFMWMAVRVNVGEIDFMFARRTLDNQAPVI